MFGFGEREIKETARLLFLHIQEADRRYLRRPMMEVRRLVEADFPPDQRYLIGDDISFCFDELPDFSFNITLLSDDASITVFGGGAYDGFMMQRPSYDALHVNVETPAFRPLGPKASRLAGALKRQYGATDPRETVRRFMGR